MKPLPSLENAVRLRKRPPVIEPKKTEGKPLMMLLGQYLNPKLPAFNTLWDKMRPCHLRTLPLSSVSQSLHLPLNCHRRCLMLPLILQSSSKLVKTPILIKPGNCVASIDWNLSQRLWSILCRNGISMSLFLALFGMRLSSTVMSTSKSSMLPCIRGTTIKTNQKTLRENLCLLGKTTRLQRNLLSMKRNGFESLEHGKLAYLKFTLTALWSCRAIDKSLPKFFVQSPTGPLSQFSLTLMCRNAIPKICSIWMITITSTSHWLLNFSRLQNLSSAQWLHLQVHLSGPLSFAKTGMQIGAQTLAVVGAGTVSAANVEESIVPLTTTHGQLHLKLADKNEMLKVAEQVELALGGTRSINPAIMSASQKRKATDVIDAPSYRRNFVWDPSASLNISPSALYTETAEPLPSPPQHLLDDPLIKAVLVANKDFIKVETPFDINRLENLLIDHPNPAFVHSVLCGLRFGFWPCDDGEWKLELEEVIGNYSTDVPDLDAIRVFRDREQAAGHWSSKISELLPSMKTSPMFVVWQGKPHVVTDHSGSGINDHIPREDVKVRYDNMHNFGCCLCEVCRAHPGRRLVLFKDDVASAFLNLPAHPIWQLRQVVSVDGKLYIVRHLVFGNRASPRIWCAVSGLLCWIAVRKLDIDGLHVYMDDYFGWDFEGNNVFYRGKLRPRRQVQLLIFWEHICCSFDDKKQEHGATLKIIGFGWT